MASKKELNRVPKTVYNEAQKAKICLEIMTGKITRAEAGRVYNANETTIQYWINNFKKFGLPVNLGSMNEQQNTSQSAQSLNQDPAVLQKNNEELQQALRLAELKIAALETLIDTAEAELAINIRKKPVAKQ